jgi:hypothetical protein
MWAVNEADLSAQTASGYVHVVMLHCGLGVGLTVADLPLLPPPVLRVMALLALCPSLLQNALSSGCDVFTHRKVCFVFQNTVFGSNLKLQCFW